MRINKDSVLFSRPVAHRGLWGGNIIENSIPAYENAVSHGYPIEIDVYCTTDGVLMSFHDKSLKRMTGADGFIYEKSFAELNKLSLLNSGQKIPTLDQVLECVDGKVPLLIELKDQPDDSYIEKFVVRMKKYKGEFAVQAFNPLYINKVKKLAPEFIRGILGTHEKVDGTTPFTRFIIRKLPLNFLIKPDFISYNHTALPLKKRKTKNKFIFAWTLTDQLSADRALSHADNVIFENFIPKK
ncbi:MAG: hypothetical protein IJV95_01285 [Clostridia bacterium]|nr:hypothetical protein [Clostridia bacterium]